MSYFTFASTEYDLPHPTLSRRQPRFYIPDRSVYSPGQSSSAAFPGDRLIHHSRQPSARTLSSAPYSGHSTPYHDSFYGSASRASIAALRHALHAYHPRDGADPHTPPRQLVPRGQCPPPPRDNRPEGDFDESSADPRDLGDPTWAAEMWGRPVNDPIDALIDIHRVLYRGSEDPAADGSPAWAEQGKEVRRVVEQWFEGDCVYDHPLIRLSSRQSVLSHFALLQLLSTAYLPSLTPSSLLLHARGLTSRARGALLGTDDIASDVQAESISPPKRVVDPVDEWLQSSGSHGSALRRDPSSAGWWKLWDVSAECRDIGCMECYEGYHLALIDHVISLTLFPSIVRQSSHGLTPSPSSDSLSSLGAAPPRGFLSKLAASALREFDFLLHWDLPVSTIVEFNEVGKATHVRDVVDVRDVIDTFVPFAKRFNWLSRHLTGMVSSTIGSVAMSLLPGHSVIVGDSLRIMAPQPGPDPSPDAEPATEGDKHVQKSKDDDADSARQLGSAIGLEPSAVKHDALFHRHHHHAEHSDAVNTLGLEGISMAPDVDGESQDAAA